MESFWRKARTVVSPSGLYISILFAGLFLRFKQYFVNRSLWADEASLAINLISRDFHGLTQALDYHQAAPIGFLFIEKLSILVAGNNEYILRLFPFIAGIFSLYIMYALCRDNLGILGAVSILLFSANSWLIYYSSEFKQYSSDVLVTVLLIYLSTQGFKEDDSKNRYIWLSIAGVIGIWISHTAIFVLTSIGITLIIEIVIYKKYSLFWKTILLGLIWLFSFWVNYSIFLKGAISDTYLAGFWRRAFAPIPPWGNWSWYINIYYKFLLVVVNRTDSFLFYSVGLLLCIGGVFSLIRNWRFALTLILPFLIVLIASDLHKYPLTYRFMLFLIPLAHILLVEGFSGIYAVINKLQRNISSWICGSIIMVFLWFSVLNAFQDFYRPQIRSNIRPVVQYVGENKRIEDIIYVYYGAVPSFLYYAPKFDLETGKIQLALDDVNKNTALDQFYSDTRQLKGNPRVWFIFSDIVDCGGCSGDPLLFFTDYLDTLGKMLEGRQDIAAGAYLYDLNN